MLYLFVFVLLTTIIIDHGECEVEKIYLPYLIRFDASNVSKRPNLFTDHIQLFSQCESREAFFFYLALSYMKLSILFSFQSLSSTI